MDPVIRYPGPLSSTRRILLSVKVWVLLVEWREPSSLGLSPWKPRSSSGANPQRRCDGIFFGGPHTCLVVGACGCLSM
jgi:hypothetical protein